MRRPVSKFSKTAESVVCRVRATRAITNLYIDILLPFFFQGLVSRSSEVCRVVCASDAVGMIGISKVLSEIAELSTLILIDKQ